MVSRRLWAKRNTSIKCTEKCRQLKLRLSIFGVSHRGLTPRGRAAFRAGAWGHPRRPGPCPWPASRPRASWPSSGRSLVASSSAERLKSLQQQHCKLWTRLKAMENGQLTWQLLRDESGNSDPVTLPRSLRESSPSLRFWKTPASNLQRLFYITCLTDDTAV